MCKPCKEYLKTFERDFRREDFTFPLQMQGYYTTIELCKNQFSNQYDKAVSCLIYFSECLEKLLDKNKERK